LTIFLTVGCINTTYTQDDSIKVLYPIYEPEYATGAMEHRLTIHLDQRAYASETACSKAVSELVRQNLKDQKVCAIPVCRPKSWYDAYVVTFSRRSNTYWCGKIEEFEAKLKMVEEEVGHY
jgi:hypothetical protein